MLWASADVNNRTFLQYYNRLTELAINMFEWKNLPSTIDPRWLELCLFSEGKALFFYDDVIGHLCLKCTLGGKLNVYQIPMERRAYASNGYNKKLSEKDSVIIYNNYLHSGCMNDIEMYAYRLYEIERTIDVNVKAQKTPVAILCDEKQRLTMKNLYMQYDGNEPFIFGSKDLDLKGVTTINTGAPFIGEELNRLKKEIFNEALTYLGVANINEQKKERLITDEVQRNMGGTIAQQFTRLNSRKEACQQINEMFGLDIDVDYRETIQPVSDEDLEGGAINE